jgi:hypothetical protein
MAHKRIPFCGVFAKLDRGSGATMNSDRKRIDGDEIWSDFWRTASRDGCTTGFPPAVRSAIADRWRALLAMRSDTPLLDIATGRGAVLYHALAAGSPPTMLTGIDRAALPDAPPGITLRTSIDAAVLPFPDRSFARVTSQFGIEYAGWRSALAEAARVADHALLLLLHHRDGVVVRHGVEQASQAEALNRDAALLAAMRAGDWAGARRMIDCLRDGADNVAMLDQLGHAITVLSSAPPDSAATGHVARELSRHAARMRAMADAALDDAALEEALAMLRAHGFDAHMDRERTGDGDSVAVWLIAYRKGENS